MKIAYLIGQYPAINHYYLLREIQYLRALGHEVYTASVSAPDRSSEQMRPVERDEAASTFYVKQQSPLRTLGLAVRSLVTHPARLVAATKLALRTARFQRKGRTYAFYYLAEALLLADWMRSKGLSHVHASFTSSIAWLAVELDSSLTFSFGVYGFGELYDPVGSQLSSKIQRAVCVRSVSQHGVGQLMLASPPAHWPKLQHVDLGIDLAEFSARPTASHDDGLELLTVGRLSPEKGHRLLLDAMGALRHLPVRLRIVGDGPDRAFLESEVRRRDLGESVLFEGRVSQPRLEELYRQAGAFILGSLYEGTPIVLMEAMAMQIPCLAPMINGVPEVVAHGKTGLLFSPGDAAALAEQVQILLREPGVRDEFARAGREAVIAHYDLQKNTARWANVLAASLPGMSSR